MDEPREAKHEGRQHQQRNQREECQPGADPQHQCEREGEAHEGVDGVHDRRAGRHADGERVVRGPAHQVAGARLPEEAGVERHEVTEEVVAKVALDLATHAVEQLAHAELRRSSQDGGEHEQGRIGADHAHGDVGVTQPVDPELDQVGTGRGEDVGDDDEDQSDHHGPTIRPEVRKQCLEFVHRSALWSQQKGRFRDPLDRRDPGRITEYQSRV